MLKRLEQYERDVNRTIRLVAEYWAPVVEAYAKENRPWMDRTGLARAGLRGFVDTLAQDTVVLYLAHGRDYGVHLELKYQGRYAIILPTLRAHYSQIMKMVRQVFG